MPERTLPQIPCSHCGAMFTPSDSQMLRRAKGGNCYCTDECRYTVVAAALTKPIPEINCSYCNARFYPTPRQFSDWRHKARVYCSGECHDALSRKPLNAERPASDHLCECGCGQYTPLYTKTVNSRGQIRGTPTRFMTGHNPDSTGGIRIKHGYHLTIRPRRTGDNGSRYKATHIIIAETALGKPLPPKAVVHHVDGNPMNNTNNNLLICQDNAYHRTIHRRQRAMAACGNPDWRKCRFCKVYDGPENLAHYQTTCNGITYHAFLHRECAAADRRSRVGGR